MTLRTFFAAAVIAGLGGGAASAQEHVFKLHHFLSAQAPAHTQMLEPWARQVEENSGGAVRIEIYPSMTLGGRPPELINQARDGVVDLVWVVNGYAPGLFTKTEVFELPGVYTNDTVATNLAMHDMFADTLADEYKGLEVMFLHVNAGLGLQMASDEVRKPGDLAGKALRIPNRTGAWSIAALGANPVAMPVPELPQALSKGVVDGAMIPWEIIPALKLQDQTEYQIEGADKVRFGGTVFQLSMNKRRWDRLPADVQQAFRDASGRDWVAEVGRIWRDVDEKGIAIATAAGNTHVTLDDEETAVMMEALAPVVTRWIDDVADKGIDGAALVARARTAIDAARP